MYQGVNREEDGVFSIGVVSHVRPIVTHSTDVVLGFGVVVSISEDGEQIIIDLTGFFPLGVCGVADRLFFQMGVASPPLIGAMACPIPWSTRSANRLDPWTVRWWTACWCRHQAA